MGLQLHKKVSFEILWWALLVLLFFSRQMTRTCPCNNCMKSAWPSLLGHHFFELPWWSRVQIPEGKLITFFSFCHLFSTFPNRFWPIFKTDFDRFYWKMGKLSYIWLINHTNYEYCISSKIFLRVLVWNKTKNTF